MRAGAGEPITSLTMAHWSTVACKVTHLIYVLQLQSILIKALDKVGEIYPYIIGHSEHD